MISASSRASSSSSATSDAGARCSIIHSDIIERMIEHLAPASDVALLDEDARLEAEIIRLRYRQLEVRAELNARNVPATLGYPGLAPLLAARLRYSPAHARKRAQAVERFGARRALTGEAL